MSVNFEYYKVFYYVGKELNISHAAEKLFLGQSAISKTIQKLEKELDCKLLDRDNRGVKLTLEGQYLYEEIAEHCEWLLQTSDRLSRRKREEQGVVRLASNSDVSWYILNECIERFKMDYPEVNFSNTNIDSKLIGKALKERKVDMGFLFTPDVDPRLLGATSYSRTLLKQLDEYEVTALGSYYDIAVAGSSVQYLNLAKRLIKIEDLENIPAIFSVENDYYAKQMKRNDPPREIDNAARDVKTRIELAKMNMGVTFMPRFCVEDELKRGTLVELDIVDLPMMKRDFFALTEKGFELPVKSKVFLEATVEKLSEGDL